MWQMIKSRGVRKLSLPFLTIPLQSCLHPIFVFPSTLTPTWSSNRFHFPFLISASLSPFSFFHWGHLLRLWQARFYNKYTCPPWCFFLFLFPLGGLQTSALQVCHLLPPSITTTIPLLSVSKEKHEKYFRIENLLFL
jgi:hypothetical protein